MPTVRVQTENGDVTVHELEGDAITMGRSELCVLRIHDLSLSRIHAVLRLEKGQWLLSDAGSRSGTKLNGETIKGAHRLEAGDEIQLGTCLFVFEPTAMAMATPIPPTKSMASARPPSTALPPAAAPRPQSTAGPASPAFAATDQAHPLAGSTAVHLHPPAGGEVLPPARSLARDSSPRPSPPRPVEPPHLETAAPSSTPQTEKGAQGSTAPPAEEATRAFAMPVLGVPVETEQPRGDRGSTNPALIGRSTETVRLRGQVSEFSNALHPLLITGPTGTEKEYVARAVHDRSSRASQPFLSIQCPALGVGAPELFGQERDSTPDGGASAGLLAAAHGGTVFLAEVAELTSTVQAMLLDFLQTGQIPSGVGALPRAADVRILASTRHDLADLVEAGFFLPELHELLRTQTITVPGLAARAQDIPDLVGHFLSLSGSRVVGVSREALDALSGGHFKENVQELRYVVERARNSCDSGTIEVSDLPRAYQPEGLMEPEADALFLEVSEKRASFWDVVQSPLIEGKISKRLVRALIARAYREGGESYKGAATRLGVGDDFQRFLNFVNRNGLGI